LIVKKDSIYEVESRTSKRINAFGHYHDSSANTSTSVTATNSASTNSVPGSYGSEWITYAVWINTTVSPIAYFSTSWTVPTIPYTDHGQVVYLFNALEDAMMTSSAYIIQPVLQYGKSNAGGGSYYSIGNWYGGGTSGQYWYSSLTSVLPGANLQGVIQMTVNGSDYSYTSSFAGYPTNTSISFSDPLQMNYAFETLEAGGIQFWGDYPTLATYPNTNVQHPDVPMTNIEIKLADGTNAVVNWTAINQVTDIKQHTTIVTQGSPNGEVDLYFTDPWTPPPAPTINNNSSVYFNSQVGSGGGGIRAQAGQLVTVTVGASGPPSGNYSTSMSISGVSFTDGSSSISVTNGSASKQFTMVSSGYVSWTGNFQEPNNDGGGYVGVK
jgi:hypothetical protein